MPTVTSILANISIQELSNLTMNYINISEGKKGPGSDLVSILLKESYGVGNKSWSLTNISDESFASILFKLSKKSKDDDFKRILNYLNLYLMPVIILVGVIGNVMSLCVFSFTHLRRLSSSVYLSSLALADTGFLVALFVIWLTRVNVKLFQREGWCQSTLYFIRIFSFMSVWSVVSFTAERYIMVYHPLRKDTFCTKKKAKCVVVSLVIIAGLLYNFEIWTSGVIHFENKSTCTPLLEYYEILTIMTSLDTFVTWVIPSLIIVVLNVRIIIRIHHYQLKMTQIENQSNIEHHRNALHRRRSMMQASISSTGSMHIKFSSTQQDNASDTAQNRIASPERCQKFLRHRSQIRTARMLLVLSSVFVLLNLPSHIFRVQAFVKNFLGGSAKSGRVLIRWEEFFQLVYFLNFAINFFVYSACARQFRSGLKRLYQRCAHSCKHLKNFLRCRNAPRGHYSSWHQTLSGRKEVIALRKKMSHV